MFNFLNKKTNNIHEPVSKQLEDVMALPEIISKDIINGADCDEISGASGPFGSITNPIPVNGFIGEIKYLGKLTGKSGFGFFFHKLYSRQSEATSHPVDVFELVSLDGGTWTTLCFDIYHPRRSNKCPAGFQLKPFDKKLGFDFPFAYGVLDYLPNFPYDIPDALLSTYNSKAFSEKSKHYLQNYIFERKNKNHTDSSLSGFNSADNEHQKIEENTNEIHFNQLLDWWKELSNFWKKIFLTQIGKDNEEVSKYTSNSLKIGPLDVPKYEDLLKIISLKKISFNNTDSNSNNYPITDFSPLKTLSSLREIEFRGNKELNLQKLNSLICLESICCTNCNLSDLQPLCNLINLKKIDCSNNNIVDLSPVSGLSNITCLICANNKIENIGPLINLQKIEWLSLSDNNITDIGPIASLTNLNHFSCEGNKVSDLSPLINLKKLTSLYFADNYISDLSPLYKMKHVTQINFQQNFISNIDPLRNLEELTYLRINQNKVSNINALCNCKKLSQLVIACNDVSDISSLEGLQNLEVLNCYKNRISDFSPLINLKKLKELNCKNNPCSSESLMRLKQSNANLNISN